MHPTKVRLPPAGCCAGGDTCLFGDCARDVDLGVVEIENVLDVSCGHWARVD